MPFSRTLVPRAADGNVNPGLCPHEFRDKIEKPISMAESLIATGRKQGEGHSDTTHFAREIVAEKQP